MENAIIQSVELEAPALRTYEPRSPELKRIQEVIDLYIDGMYNGKVASLQQAFHPTASIFGTNITSTNKEQYLMPIQGLFDYCATTPVPAQTGEPTTFVINAIRVTGNAATVEMVMDHYHGNNYVDYFQLLKIEDRWWIVSKTFDSAPSAAQ